MATPALAQFLEPSRLAPDLQPDPIARSARLLGMGRLTLLDDRHNRIQLWEYSGLPVGLYDSDSVSTFDLRPATRSSSSSRDFGAPGGVIELQDAASRGTRFNIEAVRRPGQGTAYGLLGDFGSFRRDDLYSSDSEKRSELVDPLAIPVITGRLPWINPERWRYSLFGVFGVNDSHDEYRRLSATANGRYVDRDGTLLAAPNYFEPDEYFVRRVGGGGGLSYLAGTSVQLALGGHIVSNGIEGANEGERYDSETRERRPVYTARGAVIARFGPSFELVSDGQVWNASSQTTWVFTLSPSGGPGPTRPPLTGRGEYSKRKEDGTRSRLRARWITGNVEFGAGFGGYTRTIEITPSPLSSANSFNSFRIQAFSQIAAADTIGFPEDVLSSRTEERDWEASGGVSSRVMKGKGLIGVEYHYVKRKLERLTGQGAHAEEVLGLPPIASESDGLLWDVRVGAEYRCTDVLSGRAGYIYRSQEISELIELDEYLSHTVTGGIGLASPGSRWDFQAGYAFEWDWADYGDPTRPRSTRQQLGAQLRWSF